MGLIERFVNRVGNWGCVLGIVFISIVTLVIGGDVLARHLGTALPGTYDMVETLVVVGVAFTLVYAQMEERHTRAEILVERLHGRTKATFAAVTTLLSLFYWAVLAYTGFETFVEKFTEGENTQILKISVVPFRGVWVFAALLMFAMLLIKLFHHVKGMIKGGEQK
ncbi:MAG TPA: TRAP transporter small permease subunit [Syntrophorhabdaceae bacterium]|nr:TRAP transporter small permease subunit [Syntrophorhabdaceae bacterium]